MKTLFKPILILVLLLWTMGGGALTAYAEIPHLINYQGKLTETDGSPITATKQITFRIYNVLSGGAPLWEETQSITVNKGVFSTMLGSTVDLNLPFDQPYYLEIKVADEVMTPRQRIASVGYAIRAETADSSIQADNAINADTVDNKHASDFIEQGSSAGGDLTGTYPNPAIKNFGHSWSTNGYAKLPGGLIFQWGESDNGQEYENVSFPISFPNACFQVVASPGRSPGDSDVGVWNITTSGFRIKHAAMERPSRWIAVGY